MKRVYPPNEQRLRSVRHRVQRQLRIAKQAFFLDLHLLGSKGPCVRLLDNWDQAGRSLEGFGKMVETHLAAGFDGELHSAAEQLQPFVETIVAH